MTHKLLVTLEDLGKRGVIPYRVRSMQHNKCKKCWFCIHCNEAFTTLKHENYHRRKFPFHYKSVHRCPHCLVSMTTKLDLKKHMELTCNAKCRMCQKENRKIACNRVPSDSTYRDYMCRLCTIKVKWKRRLIQHIGTHKEKTPCQTCGLKLNSRYLKIHKFLHSSSRKYQCNMCVFGCQSKAKLMRHKECHRKVPTALCKICGQTFTSAYKQQIHMKFHCRLTTPHQDFIKCSLCKEKFTTKVHLHQHNQLNHSIICEVCDLYYNNPKSFEEHLHNHKISLVPCKLCGETILNLQYSKKCHLIKFHGANFQCELCHEISTHSNKLKLHYHHFHRRTKLFVCTNCEDIFLNADAIKVHKKYCIKATGKKLVWLQSDTECKLCRKQFTSLVELQAHQLSGCETHVFLDNTSTINQVNIKNRVETKRQCSKEGEKKRKELPLEKCTRCHLTFKNKLKLAKHMWHAHMGLYQNAKDKEKKDKSYPKHTPRNKFPSDTSLNVSNPNEANHNKKTSKNVQQPHNKVDKKGKSFCCLQCERKFWKSSYLERHIQKFHSHQKLETNGGSKQKSNTKKCDRLESIKIKMGKSGENKQQSQIDININTVGNINTVLVPLVMPNIIVSKNTEIPDVSLSHNGVGTAINVISCTPNTTMSSLAPNVSVFSLNTSTTHDTNDNTSASQQKSSFQCHPSLKTVNDSIEETSTNEYFTLSNSFTVDEQTAEPALDLSLSRNNSPQTILGPVKNTEAIQKSSVESNIIIDLTEDTSYNDPKSRFVLDMEQSRQDSTQISVENDATKKCINETSNSSRPSGASHWKGELENKPDSDIEVVQLKSVNSQDIAEKPDAEIPQPTELTVECFICDKSFNRINRLLHHLKHKH